MIKDLREQKNMSQAELAELAGTSQPQIKRLESGERKLTKEWAERLSPHLNAAPEVLLFGWPDEGELPLVIQEQPFVMPNAVVGSKLSGENVKIPVYGQAVGGVDGEFIMNGSVLFDVLAPPSLAGISGAYAVSVSGDSMYPRYEDGEICFVDPKRRVKKGDYVIVQVQTEEEGPILAYVKKFVRHNAEELVLEQFNPAKEIRFPSRQVASVHFVALAGIA